MGAWEVGAWEDEMAEGGDDTDEQPNVPFVPLKEIAPSIPSREFGVYLILLVVFMVNLRTQNLTEDYEVNSGVKGMVKLRFCNKGGKGMVVIRSMEVTQKKSSLTFKALDGVIRSTGANGEKVSLSHKCTEMDKQIPDLIGVSSPILEHVIFLHQEDSSWPLQEGAILKKRFDEIFDSTRYAKALDAIRKGRLEYASKVKDIKAELSGLQAHLAAAESLSTDLEAAENTLQAIDDKNVRYTKEITECSELAKALGGKIADLEEMRDRETEHVNSLNSARGISESQKGMLEKYLDYDIDELGEMLKEPFLV